IAVVKADAYGHGIVEISKRLVYEGAECLAVAFSGEAVELREAGIKSPILVLFDTDMDDVFKYDLTPVVSDRKTALLLSKMADKADRNISVHVKLDTGMGRTGFSVDMVQGVLKIAEMRGINVDGVMSHFSEADLMDTAFAKKQISLFSSVKHELTKAGLAVRLFHMSNSAAVISLPDSHFDAVRPGLMLYGCDPIQSIEQKKSTAELLPIMSLKTKILAVRKLAANSPISYGRTFITKRESIVGILPIGYADGFNRGFSNNAEVIVNGKRAPVIGRICMDLTMIDLTDIQHVEDGDIVTIIGKDGGEGIGAAELAARAGTISYEILASLGSRANRRYFN
ncbi:MAG: alanine racemase, partial [Nitrospirae bacterium]|nr:alanine racemase [Nitrospirota bacterium]